MAEAQEMQDFVLRFQEGNAEATEFPVDVLQNYLLSIMTSRKFDNKKTGRDICDHILDKYRDGWVHGIGLLKNICVVVGTTGSSIPARDTYLTRIYSKIEENNIHKETMMRRVFLILERVKRPTPQLVESESLLTISAPQKLSYYRIAFKNCWMEFLRSSLGLLDRELFKRLLRILPDSVMPHASDPEIFSSFFSHCFEQKTDVEIALLSISGLFHLISRYNLGEPDFLYARIYELLSADVMDTTKTSTSNRVFQMLIKALRSPLMPSQYIPIFAKKLLRIAVIVTNPSLTLWLVVATFNLLQENPLVAKPLIHRESEQFTKNLTNDPFRVDTSDITEAMASIENAGCLWELELLMNHSDPSVVRMSQLFATNFFSKKSKRISSDDYLFITSEQLFNRERKYGSHAGQRLGAAKRLKGDLELENIVGNERADGTCTSIPLAVSVPESSDLDSLFTKSIAVAI